MSKYQYLVDACEALQLAEKNLRLAQTAVELQAGTLRGTVPIREIARRSKLSPATVSNFFRGRLVVNSKNATRLAKLAMVESHD